MSPDLFCFQVSGMWCLVCLWLLQQLVQLCPLLLQPTALSHICANA
jgi:hypothetical protein